MNQIACVGGGYWGVNLIRNFHELGALSSICELDPARQDQLRSSYPDVEIVTNIDQILSNGRSDGLAIATPAETHGAIVRDALLAGKDVFVEKPLCLTAAEGEKLVGLAAE